MKKLMVALVFFGFCGTAALANDLPDTELLSEQSIVEFGLEEGVTESQEWAVSRCAAAHQCRGGRVIGCTAQGLVTRCQRGGNRVVCQAWGANGTYSKASDRCRR